jgi:hypothetical protein
MGHEKCGFHAFRRFRFTNLRKQGVPEDLLRFWIGHVRKAYISDMDLLRLQKALLLARMNADSTFLVDKHAPGFSSKLERLQELLEELAAENDRKIVLTRAPVREKSFKWCFNRLIPAQLRQFWRNVNPQLQP